MKDYSITSPEIMLENKAKSDVKTLGDLAVPEIIVMAMNSEILQLAKLTNASQVPWAWSPLHVGKVENIRVGLVPQGVGASFTAFLMENLVACGAKKVLFSTAFGAFQPYMKAGDFVIPSKLIIGEGTSRYYYPKKRLIKPDPEIVSVLKEACGKIGVEPYIGSTWNTDAFYREMRSQVEKLQSKGVLGVEMESSAMCTVAKFRGIKAGSILRVGDSLADFKWKLYSRDPEYLKSHSETSHKIIFEALKILTKNNKNNWVMES